MSIAMTGETRELSDAARRRMLNVRGEPLFLCDWERAVFIHCEVDAEALQRDVPFPLDLHEGRAYVSLVAFTMRDMRPRIGGGLTAWLLKPIATHGFLNVRTYVKHGEQTGIYFLAEWLPNRLGRLFGPPMFGLPYRIGMLDYRHEHEQGRLRGLVRGRDATQRLDYAADIAPGALFRPCNSGSLEEFLMERYTAFTARGLHRRYFRVWHPPWPQAPIDVRIYDDSLLANSWTWFKDAQRAGANYSPGLANVWMGRPQTVCGS